MKMISLGGRALGDSAGSLTRSRRLGFLAAALAIGFLLVQTLYVWESEWSPRRALSSIIPNKVEYVKTSSVHYILPASQPNPLLCVVLSSLLANRYPIPTLLGWKATGKYNATAAHFAKLYTMQRYLTTLPHGGNDDDLVIFGDGHDVLAQLPVQVMVERYFEVRDAADKRLSDKFGLTVEEAREKGLRQTLFWGADKMCWPKLPNEAQCSKVPDSWLPHNSYGIKSGSDNWAYKPPRFLNSGSVVGPLGDLRTFINAGIASMESTFNETFKFRNSDQIYLSRLYGKQEVARAEMLKAQQEDDGPKRDEKKVDNGTEFHIAVDHESTFVQPGCYTANWRRKLKYDQPGNRAKMSTDLLAMQDFHAYPIQLPSLVYRSLQRLYESLPKLDKPQKSAREWIASLPLETNVVTRQIFAFYHATCSKKTLEEDYKKFWFHPWLEALMRAATREVQKGTEILEEGRVVDGRRWVYQVGYPLEAQNDGALGGAWTDDEEVGFIPFESVCKDYMDVLQP